MMFEDARHADDAQSKQQNSETLSCVTVPFRTLAQLFFFFPHQARLFIQTEEVKQILRIETLCVLLSLKHTLMLSNIQSQTHAAVLAGQMHIIRGLLINFFGKLCIFIYLVNVLS